LLRLFLCFVLRLGLPLILDRFESSNRNMGSFKILVSVRKHRVGVGSNRNKMRGSWSVAVAFLGLNCGLEMRIGTDLLALFDLD
jgi:hypothetical protein